MGVAVKRVFEINFNREVQMYLEFLFSNGRLSRIFCTFFVEILCEVSQSVAESR